MPGDAPPPDDVALAGAGPGDASTWWATGQEVPVFFDHSGRRRHWVAGAGTTAVVLAAVWLCGLVGGAVGFATLPSPVAALHALVARRPVYAVNVSSRARVDARRDFAVARGRDIDRAL